MPTFDNSMELIVYLIEIIGCISFATSGAITAIAHHTDIVGVWVLSLIGIFGGGLLRDLILNRPPLILWEQGFLFLALVSLIVITIWFFLAYFDKTAYLIERHRHDFWIYLLDAIGIAVFCCVGVDSAYAYLPSDAGCVGTFVWMTVIGVITAVGGGMFRDVFMGEIPVVFRKHFYMTPCILGSLLYSIMIYFSAGKILSMIVAISLIVVLRILAILFKWNLPSAKGYNKLTKTVKITNK